MLARRSISDPTDLAFYQCAANRPVGLPELVRVTGSRWSVEECFQASKNEVGLPGPQAHRLVQAHHPGHGRPRPPGLPGRRATPDPGDPDSGDTDDADAADLATQGPAHQRRSHSNDADGEEPDELVPLTVNEIRRMHAQLHQPRHPPRHRIRWSRRRRRHKARARRSHHQRQRRLIDH